MLAVSLVLKGGRLSRRLSPCLAPVQRNPEALALTEQACTSSTARGHGTVTVPSTAIDQEHLYPGAVSFAHQRRSRQDGGRGEGSRDGLRRFTCPVSRAVGCGALWSPLLFVSVTNVVSGNQIIIDAKALHREASLAALAWRAKPTRVVQPDVLCAHSVPLLEYVSTFVVDPVRCEPACRSSGLEVRYSSTLSHMSRVRSGQVRPGSVR